MKATHQQALQRPEEIVVAAAALHVKSQGYLAATERMQACVSKRVAQLGAGDGSTAHGCGRAQATPSLGIMIMTRDWEQQFLQAEWRDTPLFGFEAECQCEDILLCWQSGISTALEWPDRHPLVIASTDINRHLILPPLQSWSEVW